MDRLKRLARQNNKRFEECFDAKPALTVSAPGRINIIGEHTDYNLGFAMPAAIDRWILVTIRQRKGRTCEVYSVDFDSRVKIKLGREFTPSELWQRYVFGAISIIHDAFHPPHGFDAVISGNIPIGSGLSSSGALEVALMNAFRSLYKLEVNDLELIKLCSRVEHEHLQIQSGLLDQFASQFSKRGHLMVLDFEKLACNYFAASMPDFAWVIVDSRVKRDLAHSRYMERVEECRKGLTSLRKAGFSLTSFRHISKDHLPHLTGSIYKRIRHYINENSRVLAARECILQHDFQRLGALLNESHCSLKSDYEVSCEELDFLVGTATRHPACVGARMMGGGFGGCTLNLVQNEGVKDFMKTIKQHYWNQFSQASSIYRFKLVDGAGITAGDKPDQMLNQRV